MSGSYQQVVDNKKERTKERNTDIDIGYRTSTSADIHPVGYRRPALGTLKPEDFFSGEFDPVDLAVAVTLGRRTDRALWRTYLRNGSIAEADFLQCVYQQWREDAADGMPNNPPACLTVKLRPFLKGGAR